MEGALGKKRMVRERERERERERGRTHTHTVLGHFTIHTMTCMQTHDCCVHLVISF